MGTNTYTLRQPDNICVGMKHPQRVPLKQYKLIISHESLSLGSKTLELPRHSTQLLLKHKPNVLRPQDPPDNSTIADRSRSKARWKKCVSCTVLVPTTLIPLFLTPSLAPGRPLRASTQKMESPPFHTPMPLFVQRPQQKTAVLMSVKSRPKGIYSSLTRFVPLYFLAKRCKVKTEKIPHTRTGSDVAA